jgi:hypothetical protein
VRLLVLRSSLAWVIPTAFARWQVFARSVDWFHRWMLRASRVTTAGRPSVVTRACEKRYSWRPITLAASIRPLQLAIIG